MRINTMCMFSKRWFNDSNDKKVFSVQRKGHMSEYDFHHIYKFIQNMLLTNYIFIYILLSLVDQTFNTVCLTITHLVRSISITNVTK